MVSISSLITYAAVWLRKQLADQDRFDYVSAGAFFVFVAGTFFVRRPSTLAVVPVILIALDALRSGAVVDILRRNAWFGLFWAFLALWIGFAVAIGNPGYKASDLRNPALLGAFCLFVAQICRSLSSRQILSIIAVVGGASAFASIMLHFVSAPHFLERMVPLGRGGNPILGSGGFAVALIALLALQIDQAFKRGWALAAFAAAAVLLVAIVWTQSRAPIIALALAVPLAFWLSMRGGKIGLLIACLAAWAIVTGFILFEPSIKAFFCDDNTDWCRPAHRAEIWGWVRRQVELHPWLGSGPGFRFEKRWMTHPHNGIFGIVMFYGFAIFAAFIGLICLYAGTLSRVSDSALRFFGMACLIFSFGYMGADLSNPFAYFNVHYLFLWLPFFFVFNFKRYNVT